MQCSANVATCASVWADRGSERKVDGHALTVHRSLRGSGGGVLLTWRHRWHVSGLGCTSTICVPVRHPAHCTEAVRRAEACCVRDVQLACLSAACRKPDGTVWDGHRTRVKDVGQYTCVRCWMLGTETAEDSPAFKHTPLNLQRTLKPSLLTAEAQHRGHQVSQLARCCRHFTTCLGRRRKPPSLTDSVSLVLDVIDGLREDALTPKTSCCAC